MLKPEVQTAIKESVLCWLATVSQEGEPNVSPKEMFVADGDTHLLIAHIASPISVRNIHANPKVCVSFVNVYKQKGFKLKGDATILCKADPAFDEKVARIHSELGGEAFPVKAVIQIEVTSVSAIIAPSYWLFPDKTTEAGQIEQALQAYRDVSL